MQFLPTFYVIFNENKERRLDISKLREFITGQAVGNESRLAAATVGLPKASFSYDTDGALESLSSLDGASQ